MASVTEIISVATAISVPTLTVLGAVIRNRFLIKDKKIELLEAKLDAKEDIIDDLKLQKSQLEITGTLVNRFFSQLPSASEVQREIK